MLSKQLKKTPSLGTKHTMDMTEGAMLPLIVRFAIPLLLGNLFQQFYNMVDAWVIGQTGIDEAYAAVGNVGPVINIIIGFFSGFATGAGVLISQSFGKGDHEKVNRSVHTATAITLILCALFTLLGVLLTPWVCNLVFEKGEGSSVTPYAIEYLTIYFAGISFLLIYNMGSGILRAVGDSKHPFYYLVYAALTNIVLDLVFVFGLKMGVAGVALATVLAQGVSAFFTVLRLLRIDGSVRLFPKKIALDWSLVKEIVRLGLPAAIQVGLTAFANVFVQSYIAGADGNQTINLGGFTTYSKIDQIIFLPMTTFGLAITTFVGQNVGVGNYKRAKQGTFLTIGITYVTIAVLISFVWIFAPAISRIFNANPEVCDIAVTLLRTITPCFLFSPLNQILAGSLRGLGKSSAPMIAMLTCFVGLRQVYLYIASNFISNSLISIVISYPVGWLTCALMILPMYLYLQNKEEKRYLATKSEVSPETK